MDRRPSDRQLGEGGGPRASGEALEVEEEKGEEKMSEGEGGDAPIESDPGNWEEYKGYEYAWFAGVDGSWICRVRKDKKMVYRNEGKVSSGNMDESTFAAMRAATDWIDTQEAAD